MIFFNESEEWWMNCFVQVSLCYTVVLHVFFAHPGCMYTTRQSTNKKMTMTIKWWSIDITVITGFIKPIINKRYCTII